MDLFLQIRELLGIFMFEIENANTISNCNQIKGVIFELLSLNTLMIESFTKIGNREKNIKKPYSQK